MTGGSGGGDAQPECAEIPNVAAPPSPGYVVKRSPGVAFLFDPDSDDLVGTMIDQGGGTWRCKAPGKKGVVTVNVPDSETDPVAFVAAALSVP